MLEGGSYPNACKIFGIAVQQDKLKGADLPRDQRPRLYLSSPMEN